jgi:hypothetical protein
MLSAKKEFLQHRFPILLRKIPSDRQPAWGKMTLQQMIEHFSDSVRIASGRTVRLEIMTPPEHLDKYREFVMSDKPFKENTRNALMPEAPAPVVNPSVDSAVQELQKEIGYFFSVFEQNKMQVTRNPFFGDLNYDQNVQLLYKHAMHHLRQFGVDMG